MKLLFGNPNHSINFLSEDWHWMRIVVVIVVVVVVVIVVVVVRLPVCAVWPDYEVGKFQHWSGTAPNLVSVANVTSKMDSVQDSYEEQEF